MYYRARTRVTYNKCSIRVIVINKAASVVEEISFVNEHDRTSLSTYQTVPIAIQHISSQV